MNRQQRRSKGRGDAGGAPTDEADLDDAALADGEIDEVEAGEEEELEDEGVGTAIPARRSSAAGSSTATGTRRATPRQFLHEVNVEMRKVVWPSRAETINYASVVLVTLAVLMALIFVLDLAFTKVAGYLFT